MNLEDASRLLLTLEGVRVERHTTKTQDFLRWLVGDVVIAWERPLSKKDAIATGVTSQVLAVHVADLGEKTAWLNEAPDTCFDSPHFAGYPAVLVNLDSADAQVLLEIADAAVERACSKTTKN